MAAVLLPAYFPTLSAMELFNAKVSQLVLDEASEGQQDRCTYWVILLGSGPTPKGRVGDRTLSHRNRLSPQIHGTEDKHTEGKSQGP